MQSQWTGDLPRHQIGCRICLQSIGPDQPSTKLLEHTGTAVDPDDWRRFLLDTMGLRVPGVCRVPQHLCQHCGRNLRMAYGMFSLAERSTKILLLAHEQREQRQGMMSRNGDGAAAVLPTGRKTYFADGNGDEGEIQCVAEEAAAEVLTRETMANVHNFDDLAAACIADSEDDLFQMVQTMKTSDDEDVKPNIENIRIKLESVSQAMQPMAMQIPITRTTIDTSKSPEVSSNQSKAQPSTSVAPSTGVFVVRRDEVLRTSTMLSAARQVAADSNFDAHRLQDDNRGYQLLQRQGWQPGDTIGRNSDGIAEPIQVAMKQDRRCLGASEQPTYLSHPIMFNYVRQMMLKNGRVQTLVFGRDFGGRELAVIRGVAGRMRFRAHFAENGSLHVETQTQDRHRNNYRR